MTFANGDKTTECYGDNCRGCEYYNDCGYIRVSNPFRDKGDEDLK